MTEDFVVFKPVLIATAGVTGAMSLLGNGAPLERATARQAGDEGRVTPVALTAQTAADPISDAEAIERALAAGERRAAEREIATPTRRAPWREASQDARPENRWTVTGSVVNLRAGPSSSDPVVGRVERGDRLAVRSGTDGNWIEVRADGKPAWIYGRYLSPDVAAAR